MKHQTCFPLVFLCCCGAYTAKSPTGICKRQQDAADLCLRAGGVIICTGNPFSGTFRNCGLLRCQLHIANAASLSLHNCSFFACQPGVTVSGGATLATLHGCVLRACPAGIVADRGACVAAGSCTIFGSETMVVANDPGTHVTLEQCTLRGNTSEDIVVCGVAVHDATVVLRGCTLADCRTALRGIGVRTAIEADAVVMQRCACTMRLHRHAWAALHDCRVDDRGLNLGLAHAQVALSLGAGQGFPGGARAQLVRCSFRGFCVRGLAVEDSSALEMRLCEVESKSDVLSSSAGGARVVLAHCNATSDSKRACIWLTGASTRLRMHGCCVTGDTCVCHAVIDVTVGMVDCRLTARGGSAAQGVVNAEGGVAARLHRCELQGGVAGVRGFNSTVMLTDTVVRDALSEVMLEGSATGGTGVVCKGGRVRFVRGAIEGCAAGVIALQTQDGDGGAITFREVRFSGCMTGGIVNDGMEASFEGCTVLGASASGRARISRLCPGYCSLSDVIQGILLATSVRVVIQECAFEGVEVGVVTTVGCDVLLRRCRFRSTSGEGTGARLCGKAQVEDCSFSGVQGVHANMNCNCTIRRCVFTDAPHRAVWASDMAIVRVVSCDMTRCAYALTVLASAEIAAQDVRVSRGVCAATVQGGGCTLTAKRMSVTGEAAGVSVLPVPSTVPSRVQLVDCTLHCMAAEYAVFLQHSGLDASLLRCTVSGATVGLFCGARGSVRVRESEVARCRDGVVVGERDDMLTAKCNACGRGGAGAARAAREALWKSKGMPEQAGGCAHTGAVVAVLMTDVSVTDCEHAGVRANVHGVVMADRVRVSGCSTGYMVTSMVQRSEFEDCLAVGCGQGVVARRQVSVEVGEVENDSFPAIDVRAE